MEAQEKIGFKFGLTSLSRLDGCHPNLQAICHELIKEMDVSILCGHRDKMQQHMAFINGFSKLDWPRSKHNIFPSHAVDVAPWSDKLKGIDWKDLAAFDRMHKLIEEIAKRLKIKIRLGRDFPFRDLPHVELHEKGIKG